MLQNLPSALSNSSFPDLSPLVTWALQALRKKEMYSHDSYLLLSSCRVLGVFNLSYFCYLTGNPQERDTLLKQGSRRHLAYSRKRQKCNLDPSLADPGFPALLFVGCSFLLVVTCFLVGFVIGSCDFKWGFPCGYLCCLAPQRFCICFCWESPTS